MSVNQKSTRWNNKLRKFQTRNGASVVLRTFRSNCKQWGPLTKHPVLDVRARRALLRTLTLWGTWYRARRIKPRHTTPLDRSHESSEYLKQITGDDFFCSDECLGKIKNCNVSMKTSVHTFSPIINTRNKLSLTREPKDRFWYYQ